MSTPDPFTEIRMLTLHATRGANYWSNKPVTRMDLAIGEYEEISSAHVPRFTESLVKALPGLTDHQCSIGEPGGFIVRLRRGTYAAHIIEHVALELQTMIGHDVTYGRTRGGDVPGEYTMVFEHLHESVGLRAAALALEIVQRAFAGTLESVEHAALELSALAQTADTPAPTHSVLCGISGGAFRGETRERLLHRYGATSDLIVDVSPSYLLQAGLPYACSSLAVILDLELTDVPDRYRDPDRASRLMSILADGLQPGGIAIVPAKEWKLQDRARDAGARVAIFSTRNDITPRDKRVSRASAWVDGDTIMIEHAEEQFGVGKVEPGVPVAADVAATLAAFTLDEIHPVPRVVPDGDAYREDTVGY
jgi:hypothetical protein